MWKPIVCIIRDYAFLSRAVWMHTPDLHGACALRVEIDVLAIWRVVRPVVQAFGRGQANFFSAGGGDGENVEVGVSFTYKGERLAVRRPAVPVRRAATCNGNSLRSAAHSGHNVNDRFL